MKNSDHLKPPVDANEWDQPQYFFPTYENDNLLYCLEDTDEKQVVYYFTTYALIINLNNGIEWGILI